MKYKCPKERMFIGLVYPKDTSVETAELKAHSSVKYNLSTSTIMKRMLNGFFSKKNRQTTGH